METKVIALGLFTTIALFLLLYNNSCPFHRKVSTKRPKLPHSNYDEVKEISLESVSQVQVVPLSPDIADGPIQVTIIRISYIDDAVY